MGVQVEQEPIIEEVVKPTIQEEIQPIIHRQIERTEIRFVSIFDRMHGHERRVMIFARKVIQPIFEREVKPVIKEQKTLEPIEKEIRDEG